MSMSIKQRLALLRRRKNYLEELIEKGTAHSYDKGEAAALRWALAELEQIVDGPEHVTEYGFGFRSIVAGQLVVLGFGYASVEAAKRNSSTFNPDLILVRTTTPWEVVTDA